jgi:hypothetical protein
MGQLRYISDTTTNLAPTELGIVFDVGDGTALKQETDGRFKYRLSAQLWKLEELHGVWSLRIWDGRLQSWRLVDFRVSEQIEELILDKAGPQVLHNYWVCLDRYGINYFREGRTT